MAISLNKGGNLSLSKTDPNLVRILIGLGWDERATDGAAFDLDASAFLLTATGKVRGDHDFIFYKEAAYSAKLPNVLSFSENINSDVSNFQSMFKSLSLYIIPTSLPGS